MTRSGILRDLLIGILMLALYLVLFRHLQIMGAESDLVLIFLLWLCGRRTRTEVILFAAFFGFLQDAMTDLWGLHTFSKSLLIFVVYGYLNKVLENRLHFWQVFLLLVAMTFFHNLILIGLSYFTLMYAGTWLIFPMLIVGSLYTAVIGTFLYLMRI